MSDVIKVDVWSDVQCPWCYIGKRKFEAGAAAFGGAVEVEYHSFELAPDTPVDFDGTTADYLMRRRGLARPQIDQMLQRVTGIAEAVGLDFAFDQVHQTNTVKAHELLHFAKGQGAQLPLAERLFRGYFTEGRHVGRVDELASMAADVGLDRDEATSALTSGRYLADVKADMAQAQEYGITGVPFFVFDGRYGVSGAQEATVFAEVLAKVGDEKVTA